ncbi:MAG TPA: hypothetical protein VKP60_12160 [Magnetospirillaceae bacterium]|nr:hypothetical protein [Magnetospirillaceae bacterium]
MPIVFIAHSKQAATWGADVGLGKNIFLLSTAEDADAAAAFLAAKPCGAEDWVLVKKEDIETADAEPLQNKLAAKEKRVDPNLYPRLRGFQGLFKVKLENVENHVMVKKALDGEAPKEIKIKPADIAAYLLHNALK